MSIQSEINRITTAVSDQESLIGKIVDTLAAKCVVTKPILQAKTVTPSEEVQTVTPDAGYDGLSSVTVEAAQGGEGTYGWKKCVSRLPSGYTEVEYIESTGTQYIDLGISVPHATARVVVIFEPTSVGDKTHAVTGHANTSFDWTTNFIYYVADGRFGLNGGAASGVTATAGTRYTFDYTSQGYSVNGGAFVSATRSFTDGYNDTIFYSSGTYGAFKLYAYQLYNGDELVRDLVPCKNASGIAGLYDFVNGKFYANAGSGTFAVGSTTNPPSTIEVVGYVVSDDAYAYPDGEFLDGYYYEKL